MVATKKIIPEAPWVLVVEDEEDLLEIACDALSRGGYNTVGCQSRAEAIFKLKNQPFACIVLDLRIKGGDGTDVILHVREDLDIRTPIIVVSGFIDQNLITKYGDKITTAMVKPYRAKELVEKVTNAIKKTR